MAALSGLNASQIGGVKLGQDFTTKLLRLGLPFPGCCFQGLWFHHIPGPLASLLLGELSKKQLASSGCEQQAACRGFGPTSLLPMGRARASPKSLMVTLRNLCGPVLGVHTDSTVEGAKSGWGPGRCPGFTTEPYKGSGPVGPAPAPSEFLSSQNS